MHVEACVLGDEGIRAMGVSLLVRFPQTTTIHRRGSPRRVAYPASTAIPYGRDILHPLSHIHDGTHRLRRSHVRRDALIARPLCSYIP